MTKRFTARFQWVFPTAFDAQRAAAALRDKDACHSVSSLFDGDTQVDGLTTNDVTEVFTHAKYRTRGAVENVHIVEAHVAFTLDDVEAGDVAFSPAVFDGEDLPEAPTLRQRTHESPGDHQWYDNHGEANDWGLCPDVHDVPPGYSIHPVLDTPSGERFAGHDAEHTVHVDGLFDQVQGRLLNHWAERGGLRRLLAAAERASEALVTAAGFGGGDYWNAGGEGHDANEALLDAITPTRKPEEV